MQTIEPVTVALLVDHATLPSREAILAKFAEHYRASAERAALQDGGYEVADDEVAFVASTDIAGFEELAAAADEGAFAEDESAGGRAAAAEVDGALEEEGDEGASFSGESAFDPEEDPFVRSATAGDDAGADPFALGDDEFTLGDDEFAAADDEAAAADDEAAAADDEAAATTMIRAMVDEGGPVVEGSQSWRGADDEEGDEDEGPPEEAEPLEHPTLMRANTSPEPRLPSVMIEEEPVTVLADAKADADEGDDGEEEGDGEGEGEGEPHIDARPTRRSRRSRKKAKKK